MTPGSNNLLTLVVDDEPEIRRLISRILAKAGFDTLTAANGDEGLKLATERRPDLVLLDLKMPGKPGIKVLQELRAMSDPLAVVIVSGAGDDDLAARTMALGALDYVEKPFSASDLVRRVHAALDKHRLMQQGQRR